MVTRKQIENAFQPSREVTDVRRFAGRARQVEQSYLALISHGTNLAVIGNRGVGKSSLARQIMTIAEGKYELLEKLSIETDDVIKYQTAYYACGHDIATVSDLLVRLLTKKECLGNHIYNVVEQSKTNKKINASFSAKIFGGFNE